MIDKDKIKLKAPCGNGKFYPDIMCEYNCTTCGFNRAEQKRRMKQGKFGKSVVFLHDELGFAYKAVEVKKLFFRRANT